VDDYKGLNVGDVCIVKGSTPFAGMKATIVRLYVHQFANMKAPKAYAYVKFPNGNSWDFQISKLTKEVKA
jgi:hypothetical protein